MIGPYSKYFNANSIKVVFSKFLNVILKINTIEKAIETIWAIICIFPLLVSILNSAFFRKAFQLPQIIVIVITLIIFNIAIIVGIIIILRRSKSDYINNKSSITKRRKYLVLGSIILLDIAFIIGLYNNYYGVTIPRYKVLIANLEGPELKKYRITETMIEKIREAVKDMPDINIVALDSTISTQKEYITEQILAKNNGDILIHGYYTVLGEHVVLKLKLEMNKESDLYSANWDKTHNFVNNRSQLFVPLITLNKLELQMKFAGETSALIFTILYEYYYKLNNIKEALKCLSKAIEAPKLDQEYIERGELFYLRACCYTKLKYYDKVKTDLDSAAKLSPKQPIVNYGLALYYSSIGNLDTALNQINTAIKLDSLSAIFYNAKGYIYYGMGLYEKSEKMFRIYRQKYPKDITASFNLANALYANNNLREAVVFFKECLKENVKYNLVSLFLSRVYGELNILDSALYYNDIASKYGAPDEIVKINLGHYLYLKGKYDEAIKTASETIKKYPNNYEAYMTRGLSYGRKRNYSSAVNDLELLFYSEDYHNTLAYAPLFYSYFNMKDYNKAIEIYNYAISKRNNIYYYSSPSIVYGYDQNYDVIKNVSTKKTRYVFETDALMIGNVAASMMWTGKNEEALKLYHSIIDSVKNEKEKLSFLYGNIMECFINMGQLKTALKYAMLSIHNNKDNNIVIHNTAMLYEKLGDNIKAYEYFNKALLLDPNNYEMHINKGMFIAKDKNKYDEALSEFKKCIDIDANRWEAYQCRAKLYLEKGDLKHAEWDVGKVLLIYPNIDIIKTLARIYVKQDRKREALSLTNDAISQCPNDYQLFYIRGYVNYKLKNIDKAFKDITYSLKLNNRCDTAYYYKALVEHERNDDNNAIRDLRKVLSMTKDKSLLNEAKGIINKIEINRIKKAKYINN